MIERIKDFFFPRHCPICDTVLKQGCGYICPECRKIPRIVKAPRCVSCGKHLEQEETVRCRDCSGLQKYYDKGFALYEYASVHDSVFRFKNGGRAEYASFYGEEIRRYLLSSVRELKADALVPIPLHRSKLLKRGYNQATLLAKEISMGTGVPIREDLLERVKKTDAQKKMNHADRQNNMKKAFHMVQNDVKLNTVILVDDIYTTGSTIDEAAKTLLNSGVKKVYFVALACGEGV